jgi:ABC-type phosphate transport system substrate-binding protein
MNTDALGEGGSKSRGRLGRLAAAGMMTLALLALAACGSSSSTPAASPSASRSAQLAQLVTCLGSHGIKVPSPVTRKLVHAALQAAEKSTRHAAVTACEQYANGLRKQSGKKSSS